MPSSEAPGFYEVRLKPEAATEVEFIHSSHLDNPYLPQSVHDRYESYRAEASLLADDTRPVS